MATRRVVIGPTGHTVRANVSKFRKLRGLTLRELAERLEQGGRKMAHNTISEIERGARRVDVDDLTALAAALDVAPVDLLSATTMEFLHSDAVHALLGIIDEAKRVDPEATKAALGLTGAEPEVSDGDD